ncbi:MAG: tetratricopeptide repeat protein, partial [Planctomycetota bacterium]
MNSCGASDEGTTVFDFDLLPRLMMGLAALAALSLPAWAGDNDAFDAAVEKEVRARSISTTPAFDKDLEEGFLELRSGNYLKAAREFGKAYTASRDHPLPPFLVGLAYIGMNEPDKASKFILWSLKEWPGLAAARPKLSAWLTGGEEYARLAGALERGFRAHAPGTGEASRGLFLAGTFQAFGGDEEKARKFLSAVPKEAVEWPAAQLILKAVNPKTGPFGGSSPEDLFKLGNQLFTEGKYAQAAHAMGAAILKKPDDPLPYFEMGHALFAAGFFRHASRVLSLGIEIFPRWREVEMDLVTLFPLERRGDFDLRVAALKKVLEGGSRDGASFFLMGYVLYFSGDRGASKPLFEGASGLGWAKPSRVFLEKLASKGGEGEKKDGPPAPIPPPKEDPGKDKDPIATGRSHLAGGRWDDAAKAFTQGMTDPLRTTESMMGLAAAWLGKGDFRTVTLWIRSAIRSDLEEALRAPWTAAFGVSGIFEKRLAALATRAKKIHEGRGLGRKPGREERDLLFL